MKMLTIEQWLAEMKQTQDHRTRLLIIETLKQLKVSNQRIEQETGLHDYQIRHYRRVYRKLEPSVMALFERAQISYSLAKALASLPPKEQEKAARTAIAKKMSVHAFRGSRNTNPDKKLGVELERLANHYSELSGFAINIKPDVTNAKAGVWIVAYHDLDMFDAIVEKLVGANQEI